MATFQCRRDGAPFAACTTPQAYSGLADGSHTFEVRAIDQAGNVDATPASLHLDDRHHRADHLDRLGPAGSERISASASFTFSGTDTGGSGVASFQCRLDSTQAADWGSCTSPRNLSALADGSP